MRFRTLGPNGPRVSAIGLGCFGMSHAYGTADVQESITAIRLALDHDCNFLDTADVYGAGENEKLVAEAIAGRRHQVVLATKVGFTWDSAGRANGRNGRPEHIRNACEASLRRLSTDVIDLYYLHRVDPTVPVEETIGAMAELVKAGKVRFLGLSEVGTETLRRASNVHPVTALQSEYSLWTRDIERDIAPTCEHLGIAIVPFSPLGRGFFTGTVDALGLSNFDFRKSLPRFQPENLERNRQVLKCLQSIADSKQCSLAQLSLAWLLHRGQHVVPIPGTRRVNHLVENLRAAEIELSHSDMRSIEACIPTNAIVGDRYADNSIFRPD